MNIELLIFDLDGTLIDSRQDIAMAANWTREQLGFGPMDADFVAKQIGGGVRSLLKRILPEALDGQLEQGLAIFREYYLEHCLDFTKLYSGTIEMLQKLSSKKLAVVTNKPTNMTEKILRGLEVRTYFASIRGGDDVAKKKPDPAMLIDVIQKAKTPVDQAVMIGDSPVDVEAARRAGIKVCGVTYGGITAEADIIASRPDYIAHTPHDLCQLFL